MENSVRQPEPVTPRPSTGAPAFGRQPATAIGILNTTLLPSLGLHGGLSLITYGIARVTNRVELKDYLWPTGIVLNAWWTAVGRHTLQSPNEPLSRVLDGLSYYQKVLLGGATAWGARLALRIIYRSLIRKDGGDDPRYRHKKQEPGFWNTSGLAIFALEAVFQSLISLPLTLPFRQDAVSDMSGATRELSVYARWLAAGLFTAGLALESLADWQLDAHKARQMSEKNKNVDLYTGGVFSIVRHPNYLGDALVHFSFPLWTLGAGIFTPWQLLGPIANYTFLRSVGGDRLVHHFPTSMRSNKQTNLVSGRTKQVNWNATRRRIRRRKRS
jgi:steroid 5-alpha reductase family enzyme